MRTRTGSSDVTESCDAARARPIDTLNPVRIETMHGGDRIARALAGEGVRTLFTLCGGHISPILTGANSLGIRVIDTRHEATAVFAADATARLTGIPGVAVVTAGPGVTNTLTALRNAYMAHSPVVLIGGATAGPLRGRGALQDIDQLELIRSHVKWARRVTRVRDLEPMMHEAFFNARDGLPGPVFLECGVDLLYEETLVRDWFVKTSGTRPRTMADRMLRWYLQRHLDRTFGGNEHDPDPKTPRSMTATARDVDRVANLLGRSRRPVIILGSQGVDDPSRTGALGDSLSRLGAPLWLSGMARGLLAADHPLQMRHRRREALREADLVILAGVPADFRLDYGRQIPSRTTLVSINRSRAEMRLNRRPSLAIHANPSDVLERVSEQFGTVPDNWTPWIETLRGRDDDRDSEVIAMAMETVDGINPIALLRQIDEQLPDESIVVADGGDFVATASYVIRPRRPLSWLDPGPFGTLGVGAGFAIAAAIARPGSEVWLLWGDGSAGFGLIEIDTFVRHGIPLIAVIGNDACWTQIAREQIEILGDEVGCSLRSSDYHLVAEALGGRGFDLRSADEIPDVVARARAAAASAVPVVINARIGTTSFRKGSISM